MDRPQRRFLACLTALALLCAVGGGLAGLAELALYLTPAFLLAALLLSGRYIGEERIVRRRSTACPPPARHRRPRWSPPPFRPLRSLLEREPASLRGPPALLPLH